MHRIFAYFTVLSVLPVVSCDAGGQRVAEAAAHPGGLGSAAALVDAPSETIPTVVRRVRAGVRPVLYPTADGRFVSFISAGVPALRDLETDEIRRLPVGDDGYAYLAVVSPDGGQIAFAWWNPERNLTELRVSDWNGSETRTVLSASTTLAYAWSRDGRSILAVRQGGESLDPAEIVLVALVDGAVRVLETSGRVWPLHAEFSADGRFMAYDGPGQHQADRRDIFVMELQGQKKTRIVDDESNDYLLGWSPNGEHILFCSDRTGTPGVWLLPVSNGRPTGGPQLVLPDAWGVLPAGFAADGRYFYLVQTGGPEIYVATLSVDGRGVAAPPDLAAPRRLGMSSSPAWSPDGLHLAYLRQSPGPQAWRGNSLVVRSLETGEVRMLELGEGLTPIESPRWMPDGRSLVLVGDGAAGTGVYRIDVRTGRSQGLLSEWAGWNGEGMDLSRDGRFLYYRGRVEGVDKEQVAVFRKDLDTGHAEETYRAPPAPSWIWSFVVSPDGSSLAVNQVGPEPGKQKILVLPAAGGEPRELTPPLPGIGSVAWTQDGEAVLYTTYLGENPRQDPTMGVWRVALAGGQPEPVGLEMTGAVISNLNVHPDGQRLAFVAGTTSFELWVMEDFLPGYRTGNGDDGQH